MAKATWIRVEGVWKDCIAIWRKVSGTWQASVTPWIKVGGNWKDCYDMARLDATYLVVESGTFTVDNTAIDPTNATVGFTGARSAVSSSLKIQVTVYNWNDVQQGRQTVYYDSSYTQFTELGAMSEVVHTPPIPDYGYWAKLEFLEI